MPPDAMQEAARRVLHRLLAALRAAVPLCVAMLLVLYAIKAWRRHVPAFARGPALPRVSYRAALDRLAEVGLSRRYGETREAFAARAGAVAPSLGRLTVVHAGAALGSQRPLGPPDTVGLADDVRREVAERVPTWRAILGLLDPLSWVRTR
jgi:hypothetical protein